MSTIAVVGKDKDIYCNMLTKLIYLSHKREPWVLASIDGKSGKFLQTYIKYNNSTYERTMRIHIAISWRYNTLEVLIRKDVDITILLTDVPDLINQFKSLRKNLEISNNTLYSSIANDIMLTVKKEFLR